MIAEPCECCGEIENIRLQGETYLCALEAEIERLRAELATMHRSVVHECCVDKQEAETAIARVRELWTTRGLAVPPAILRALAGAE